MCVYMSTCMYVCECVCGVCMCVCVREREKVCVHEYVCVCMYYNIFEYHIVTDFILYINLYIIIYYKGTCLHMNLY